MIFIHAYFKVTWQYWINIIDSMSRHGVLNSLLSLPMHSGVKNQSFSDHMYGIKFL